MLSSIKAPLSLDDFALVTGLTCERVNESRDGLWSLVIVFKVIQTIPIDTLSRVPYIFSLLTTVPHQTMNSEPGHIHILNSSEDRNEVCVYSSNDLKKSHDPRWIHNINLHTHLNVFVCVVQYYVLSLL